MKRERWEQIERLYHAALEREPEERAAYLHQACAGDEELRRQVAALLAHDDPAASFIEAPAPEVAAHLLAADLPPEEPEQATNAPTVTRRVGAYQLLALLGKGGMGEVHLALDPRLGRKVAIKLLPAPFTADAGRVRRFAQEARAASALNHPNILTIHEIGQSEGTHFIVTEYVEGETLRQRLERAPQQPLPLAEALAIAAQIAAALAAAHEAGIVHRDIKPENVMLRRDGYVKVLDFGLAKLTEPSSPVIDSQTPTAAGASTESGVVMGTPRYMSPEQARGEKMDQRTDIFSLGVILYEMSAGRAPFAGATMNELMAAILKDEPPPLTHSLPTAPRELEQIVSRALRKDRAARYQAVSDLLDDLQRLKEELMVEKLVASPSGGSSRSRLLPPAGGTTSKRRWLMALAGMIVMIAATAAWFYFNRPPALTEKDTILLADFENQTGEEIFDVMLKQGLAIQLAQSPFLNLFPEAQMRHELVLMRRPPGERVTAEVAREICQRQNLKALIAGSIASLGDHYVITLEAINSQSGETLARAQVEAASREQVLRALSQAATQLREKLGESLSLIQRFDKPLDQATTSKLEALKAYSFGGEQAVSGRLMEAIPFYKRAVELDPDFAVAYNTLAVIHFVTGRAGLATEYAEKAYALRDRVSEYEKLRIANTYHGFVTGDVNKRIEVLMLQKRTYPREWLGANDLAFSYNQIAQSEQTIAEAREAIRLNPKFAASHRLLAMALLRLNRFAEAKEALAQALQQGLDHPDFHFLLYQLAFINNDTTEMRQQLDWARGRPDEYLVFDWQTGAAAFAGQWRKAQDFARRAMELAARGDTKEVAAQYATEQALRGAVVGDCQRARADAVQGLALERGRASLPRAALALALCREVNQAKPLVEELAKRYPADTLINSLWLPVIRAALLLQGEPSRAQAEQAIEQLQPASRYEAAAEFWPQYLRGQAYLKLNQSAEAVAEFQRILDHRGQAPLSVLYPLARLGLARAALLAADAAGSRAAYQDFFALWQAADADLPILRAARQEEQRLKP
jgi:serine/threonine protein kinase/Flp pilus assembly protein TadD